MGAGLKFFVGLIVGFGFLLHDSDTVILFCLDCPNFSLQELFLVDFFVLLTSAHTPSLVFAFFLAFWQQ